MIRNAKTKNFICIANEDMTQPQKGGDLYVDISKKCRPDRAKALL
ncbi:MAG: hypothetical protein JWO03_1440 [Bacteroidetes bacterium]|nr:hypothetical protein [Bacteroidota bacterium]